MIYKNANNDTFIADSPAFGWLQITEQELDAIRASRVAPVTAPASITMRQARLALLAAGLLDAVNAGMATMPTAVQIEWEFASTVDRASPQVALLAAALSLDDAALDALFTAGAAL